MSNQQMHLQLVRVRCADETGGSFVEKVGNDEIALSAIGIDATGAVFKLDPFSVGANFDDGEIVHFDPPKTLFTLAVPDTGVYPRTCLVTYILAEVAGGGGHQETTDGAFAKATEEVARLKADMVANGQDPESDSGLGGIIWDVVLAALIGWAKGIIVSGIKDDVFTPASASVEILSPDFHWGDGTKLSPEETVTFKEHDGKYEVVHYWEVANIS